MFTKLKIFFPKETDRKYFSKEHQGYSNNLSILIDNSLLFSNIDDAEENLPLEYRADIDLQKTLEFRYDIIFGDGTKESAQITFMFSNDCQVTIHRPNYLIGSEKLDVYDVKFNLNGTMYHIGSEYHQDDSKTLNLQGALSNPFQARWSTRKSFVGSQHIYWDDVVLELE